MRIAEWLVIVTVLTPPLVLAQEASPYSGSWQVSMVNNKGEHRKGTVSLTDRDGTWDIEHQNVKNPCAGIRAPIVIKHVSADELVFEIARSRSLRGCRDNVATLKRLNDTTLQGELDDGRKLSLSRE